MQTPFMQFDLIKMVSQVLWFVRSKGVTDMKGCFYYQNTKFLKCRRGFKADVLSSSLPLKRECFYMKIQMLSYSFFLKVNPQ